MMNILIVSQYYYPEQFLINDIATRFAKDGNAVTVLTGLPNYPSGQIPPKYRWLRKRHETIDGVKVIRCSEIPRKKGKIGLFINYISFALSASIKVLFMSKKYDIVFCYQLSPVTMAYPAILYQKLTQKPLLLYCLDIFPESLLSHVSEDSNVYRLASKMSRNIYSQCDMIGVTSMPFVSYLRDTNGVAPEKLVYLPQHADAIMLKMNLSHTRCDGVNFMFAGNIGYAQSIETIVLAASLMKSKQKFFIHIVGDGSRVEEIKELVNKRKLEAVFVFHGRVPKEKMPNMYHMADALLITLRGDNLVGNTVPGKLQTYMTVGKPIFGAINGAAADIIQKSKSGGCVAAGDAVGFAKLLDEYIEKPEKFDLCGENARHYFCENFTLDCYIKSIYNTFNKLME